MDLQIDDYTDLKFLIHKNYPWQETPVDERWCQLTISVKNNEFSYCLDTEGILEDEVCILLRYFRQTLHGEIPEVITYELIDSYLRFTFYPVDSNLPQLFDIEFVIFHGDEPSNDYYNLCICDKKDLKKFIEYFKSIDARPYQS